MSRHHDRWKDNPLVAIDGERLRQGLARKAIGAREAATLLEERGEKVSPQTILNIMNGAQRRCRRKLRTQLARLCGWPVTHRYLGGEEDLLPPELQDEPPKEFPHPSAALRPLHTKPIGGRWAEMSNVHAPRYEIEAYALSHALEKAWRAAEGGDADTFPRSAVRYLLSLQYWRSAALVHGGHTHHSQEDRNAFAEHMAKAVEVLLRPWLEGKAEARPDALLGMIAALDELDRRINRWIVADAVAPGGVVERLTRADAVRLNPADVKRRRDG